MPRRRRCTPAGYVYHVMNRSAGRMTLFECECGYAAFEHILLLGQQRTGIRILSYCVMGNHWHIWIEYVNQPQTQGELDAIRRAIETGAPYGDAGWRAIVEDALRWRSHGRPKRGRTPFSPAVPEKGVRPLFDYA